MANRPNVTTFSFGGPSTSKHSYVCILEHQDAGMLGHDDRFVDCSQFACSAAIDYGHGSLAVALPCSPSGLSKTNMNNFFRLDLNSVRCSISRLQA